LGSTKGDKFIDLSREYWIFSVHLLNPRVLRAVNAHAVILLHIRVFKLTLKLLCHNKISVNFQICSAS
jgi:hypothetical protein